MSLALEEQPSVVAPVITSVPKWKVWLPLAVFAILWLDLCRQLSYMWSTNEQYAYGWFVPILTLGLFLKKWPSRPGTQEKAESRKQKAEIENRNPDNTSLPSAVGVQRSVLSSPVVNNPRFQLSTFSFSNGRFLLSAFCFLLLATLLPLRLIHEINQDWSFCSYLLTAVVVVLSLYAVHLAGPPSVVSSQWSVVSPWVRHFAFPICFILVAVNWPYRIENSLKHRMMNAVAALTVEIAGWLNIPALRHGNVIELATGSVGVEDACSGIRSLQSTIMAAFFLGELYLLNLPRRFFLLALGVPLAFSFNIARTLFLTWKASSAGEAAVAKWHDSAGMTISLICFACLWVIALLFRKREIGKVESRKLKAEINWAAAHCGLRTTDHGTTEPGDEAESVKTKAEIEKTENRKQKTESRNPGSEDAKFQLSTFRISAFPKSPPPSGFKFLFSAFCFPEARHFLFACGLWSLFTIGVTEAWYRAHDTDPAQTVRWSAQFPTNSASARKIGIDKEVRQVLKCDQGDGLSWEEPDGRKWSAFFFRWRAGEATSRMAARDHRPEICLPSSGYKVKADLGVRFLPAQGLELPFRAYVFEDAGRVLYVFFCLWEDGADKQHGLGRSKYLDRLDSVLAGKRRLGQQTLEIIVSGYAGMEEAEQAVRQRLPSLVQIGAVPDRIASLEKLNGPMKANASGAFR